MPLFSRQIFPLSDSIWCLRRPSYLNCSYAVRTGRGVVLVDAGMDSSGEDIRALLEAMREPMDSVGAILLTHWHNDHAAGAQAIAAQSRCGVYYHSADAPWLTRSRARSGARGWMAKRIPEWGIGVLFIGLLGEAVPEAVAATEHLADQQVIADDFEVIETPGHTPGHISFYYRPERVLFAGDALAVVGDRLRFMARPVTLDLPLARKSMERCLTREIEMVCPGHRRPLTVNVRERCEEMRGYLADGGRWPLFG